MAEKPTFNPDQIPPITGYRDGQPSGFVRSSNENPDKNGILETSLPLKFDPEIGRVISEQGAGTQWQITGFEVIQQGHKGDTSMYKLKLREYKK